MFLYYLMRSFLRLVVSVFFRKIEVVGLENVPDKGAVIFAGNHPNSLMDPLLVTTQNHRVVHFAAKDLLFKSTFLRIFLTSMGAVPIARKGDHQGKEVSNQAAFDALFEVLAKGRCMGIFPEGLSHIASQLARLKTGAARIAFGVKEKYPDAPISIVPVGLTYLHQHRFRSQALVHFGAPIPIDEAWMARYEEDPREAVKALTDEMDQRIRLLTINTPDWEVMRLMHIARRLYRPDKVRLSLQEYAELTRRFAQGFAESGDEPMVQAMKVELEAYQDRLDSLGIRDHDLRKEPGFFSISMRLLGRVFYLLILLPLAIPGMLLHFPVWSAAIIAGDGLTRRKDVVATTKLVSAILIVPLLYVGVALLVWYFSGQLWIALLVFSLLPLAGFATIRVLEQKLAIGTSATAILRLLRYRTEIQELREQRLTLSAKIDKLVDTYHDPSVPRVLDKSQSVAT